MKIGSIDRFKDFFKVAPTVGEIINVGRTRIKIESVGKENYEFSELPWA